MSVEAGDTRERKSLKERAATAGVLLAAGGAVWFGALSWLSAWVYEPVRLSPRDLGLTSSAILAQATVGLVVTVVVGVLAGALAGGMLGAWTASRDPELRQLADTTPLPFVSDDPASNAAATARLRAEVPELSQEQADEFVQRLREATTAQRVAELRAGLPGDVADEDIAALVGALDRELPRAQLRFQAVWVGGVMGAGSGVIVMLLVSIIGVFVAASDSRDAIRSGHAPGFLLGLPPPWPAPVADVHPVAEARGDASTGLPACALFLGSHESTTFLRDGSTRTIRVPASSVRIDLRNANGCG